MAMRESPIRPTRRRRRPIWGILLLVIGGMVILFAIGFGVSLLIRGNDAPQVDAASSAMATQGASASALPCTTTTVTPAEVLPATGGVTVNVLNSTKRPGLARDTANVLTARGMRVKAVGNAKGEPVVDGVAEIRYGPKGAKSAQLLAYYFPGAKLVPIERKKKLVDVVLGRGFQKVNGEAEIAAALASPSPIASGPGCVTASIAPIMPTIAPTPSAS